MERRGIMLNQAVTDLLNDQVNKEFYSSYQYLAISNYYYQEGLNGFGNWFRVQAQEELDHAILFLTYLQNNSERITMRAVDMPNQEFEGFREPLEQALKHERYVTGLVYGIYSEATRTKDFQTVQFLDWFVKEQGEEEKNTEDLIRRFDLFAVDGKGLYLLDNELSTRVYTAPTLVL